MDGYLHWYDAIPGRWPRLNFGATCPFHLPSPLSLIIRTETRLQNKAPYPFFDCSFSPDPAHPVLAIGTAKKMLWISSPELLSEETRHHAHESTMLTSDMLSVGWISRYIVAGGLRDGQIRLYDARAERKNSTLRLHHGTPVYKIKRVDESRVVVAGLNYVSSSDKHL